MDAKLVIKNNKNNDVKEIIVEKKLSDEYMKQIKGTNYSVKKLKIYKRENIDCYWIDKGVKKILFKVRRNVIPKNIAKITYETYLKYVNKDKSDNSFFETDRHSNFIRPFVFRNTKSRVTGYYDRLHLNQLRYFQTSNVCRKTSFTRDNWDKWEKVIPFFEIIANQYKKLAPSHYAKQMELFKLCPDGFQIGNTPFTTITSNYNWRTAIHKDSGDYKDGMGNLTILGGDFEGGHLAFPQFGIGLEVKSGDTVIMDVHQWHCNTELLTNDTDKVRLSFVSYFREKMTKCNSKRVIDGEAYYYNK